MTRVVIVISFLMFFSGTCLSQKNDTNFTQSASGIAPKTLSDSTKTPANRPDSGSANNSNLSDSNRVTPAQAPVDQQTIWKRQILSHHPYYNLYAKASPRVYTEKQKSPGKDLYFYLLAFILILFAGIKTAFNKYFSDMMVLFFRRSMKIRQLKQQFIQNSLPSLLFNIFFVIVASFYLALLLQDFRFSTELPFWQLTIYILPVVSIIYIGKYLILKLAGWMFHLKEVTDAYIFLVFLVNKLIAIFLLPPIVIIALGGIELKTAAFTISWMILAGMYIYRFVVAFRLMAKETKINLMHLALYILAFEIMPILVISKAITSFLN